MRARAAGCSELIRKTQQNSACKGFAEKTQRGSGVSEAAGGWMQAKDKRFYSGATCSPAGAAGPSC